MVRLWSLQRWRRSKHNWNSPGQLTAVESECISPRDGCQPQSLPACHRNLCRKHKACTAETCVDLWTLCAITQILLDSHPGVMHSSRLRPCSPRWLHIHIPLCWRGAEPQAEETFALPRLPTAKRPGKNGIFYTLSWILKQIPLQGLKDIRVHLSGRTPPALRYSMRSAPSQWWRGKHPLTKVLMLCSCKGGSASPGIAETYSSSSAALTRFVFSHLFLSCELEKFGGLLIFSCLLCVLFSSSHCLFIRDLNHMITSFLFFFLKK